MSDIIGWDVGGAHLKAARVSDGRLVDVAQLPCALWQGLDKLEHALAAMRQRLGDAPRHAITTTGELTDLFPSRQAGVERLCALLAQTLRPADVSVYAGRKGFLSPEQAASHAADVASANWHASASLLGRFRPDAILVDMGSTTTDIVPVRDGKVAAAGYTDADRLAAGELVYTGLTRSFLMAECDAVPFRGRMQPLMNEYFASTADVYRILGLLDEAHDQHPTADGRDKDATHSRARLARMLGLDADEAADDEWRMLARWFMTAQMRRIEDALHLVLSRDQALSAAPIVAAGIGADLLQQRARDRSTAYYRYGTIVGIDEKQVEWSSACAPAAAMALLLS